MEIYEESNSLNGQEKYPLESTYAQVQEAEQDFYQYLSDVFFHQENSFYAVWTNNGVYVSALRIEPYMDGVLLCALETALNSRRNGYARKLISSAGKWDSLFSCIETKYCFCACSSKVRLPDYKGLCCLFRRFCIAWQLHIGI